MKTCVMLLLMSLFLISCEEKQLHEKIAGCYFQYEYVNYAWGFSHSGFTITPSGEVFTFDKATPWDFAENGKLSFTSLLKNMNGSVKLDTLISQSEIVHFQQFASAVLSGKMSERVAVGADMGSTTTKIIIPETGDPLNGYREVILTTDGDFRQIALAPEAAVIAAWIRKIRIQ